MNRRNDAYRLLQTLGAPANFSGSDKVALGVIIPFIDDYGRGENDIPSLHDARSV